MSNKTNNDFPQFFVGMFFIAIALIVSTIIGSGAIKFLKRAGDSIEATGSARMTVQSDYVIWRGSIQVTASTLSKAATEVQNYRMQLQKYLATKGLPEESLTFFQMNTWKQPRYDEKGRDTGQILHVRADQDFKISTSDVDLVENLANEIEELIIRGVPVQPYRPEYMYTKLDEARISLMSEATRDAKRRAEQIAEAADGKIGAIQKARMGVIQVVSSNSTGIADYGMYDTSTREKDVVAVVKVSFAVR